MAETAGKPAAEPKPKAQRKSRPKKSESPEAAAAETVSAEPVALLREPSPEELAADAPEANTEAESGDETPKAPSKRRRRSRRRPAAAAESAAATEPAAEPVATEQ